MQLSRAITALALLLASGSARADVGVETTTTVFHESGGPLDMTVVTPLAGFSVDLGEPATLRAQYEADVVTGASVAVVDAPGGVDAITSATRLDDVRHTFTGGLELRGDRASMRGGYTYGFESDYRSHAFSLTGRAEILERNTVLEVGYARGFDSVCNLRQPRAQEAVDRQRMPTSDGCFGGADQMRESSDVSIQTFQLSWGQSWAPVFTTQLVGTAQLVHGYQGNPYRAVWLGRTAAQENHPRDRGRFAAGLSARLWLKPLESAIQLSGRLYRDTWDVLSVTAELAWEQTLLDQFRLRVRGRYYRQTAAAFYSDDYVRFPRGQYFTGDRELSEMASLTVGGRAQWSIPPGDGGRVLGFLDGLDLVVKVDRVRYSFDEFHYGDRAIPNDRAIVGTLGIEAVFR